MALPPSMAELAHASLVMSLGYLALERFRYRNRITAMREKALRYVDGRNPPGGNYREDKAWQEIENYVATGSLRLVLGQPLDTFLVFLGSLFCFAVIAVGAVIGEVGSAVPWGDPVDWTIIGLLIISGAQPVAFVWFGHRSVARASAVIDENLKHFAARSRAHMPPDPEQPEHDRSGSNPL